MQFRDGLAIRYLLDPPCLSPRCVGCARATLSLQHALDCKKEELIKMHNEIRDCIGDMAAQVWSQVIKEPVVREADVSTGDDGLRLNLRIRGAWQLQVEALFGDKRCMSDVSLWTSPQSGQTFFEETCVAHKWNKKPTLKHVATLGHD